MASVKFDNTEIISTTYAPRFIKHESAPERIVKTAPRAMEDGDVFIAERYGQKRIFLQGFLSGSSAADLEAKIDAFKELFSRVQKNLEIDWNGGTLTFAATCVRHDFDRDHFHILFVPWTAEFAVISGEGTGAEVVIDNDASHNINAQIPYEEEIEFLGSAKPKPYIRIKAGASFPNTIKGVQLTLVETGEKIMVTYQNGTWSENGYFVFDFDALKAYLSRTGDEEEIDFYGQFPHFEIGENNIEILLGGMVCQASHDEDDVPGGGSVEIADPDQYRAQSFEVPYTDDTFKQVLIALSKTGTPTRNLWVRIETDDGGKPSGDLVDPDAKAVITAGDVGVSTAWITVPLDAEIELQAGTRYWIVLQPTSSGTLDASNKFNISVEADTYQRGFLSSTINAGSSWTESVDSDISFSLRIGGVRATAGTAGAWKLYVKYKKRYL